MCLTYLHESIIASFSIKIYVNFLPYDKLRKSLPKHHRTIQRTISGNINTTTLLMLSALILSSAEIEICTLLIVAVCPESLHSTPLKLAAAEQLNRYHLNDSLGCNSLKHQGSLQFHMSPETEMAELKKLATSHP